MAELSYAPVGQFNWTDFEKLFESKGGPHHCWCMVWRNLNEGTSRANKTDKKKSMKAYVDQQRPVGLLCYAGLDAVGWCSIAPRESYRDLSGENALKKVWSLTCFFIKKEYRQQGISAELIKQAIQYAKANGANYVEAYPVDPESPSYRFMGFRPVFEKLGFTVKGKAGRRRYVMNLKT